MMNRNEMILSLGNALIMIETVTAQGESNWNALLASKQQIKRVYETLKEEEHADQDEQGAENRRRVRVRADEQREHGGEAL